MKIEIPIKKRYELPNLLIPEEITAKDVRKAYGRGYEEGVIQASYLIKLSYLSWKSGEPNK